MQKKEFVPSEKKNKAFGRKRFFIILISALLATAVIFGAVLGVVAYVRSASAVVSFDGVTMDEKVATFFIGRFKTKYIYQLRSSGYPNADNTESFWNSKYDENTTHGELFTRLATNQLREIAVTSYLFDRYYSLTDADEEKIEKAIAETLEYQTGGSDEEFERLSAEYGFDYDSYCEAVEMLYKAERAFTVIYGSDGSALSSDSASCEKYLSEYSHVSLIFIRTNDKLVTQDDGSQSVASLTEAEREARLLSIEKIRAAIAAYNNGTDGQINAGAFAQYLKEYGEGDKNYDTLGHYFHKNSEFTSEYAQQFPEITEKALSMKVGEYAEVAVDMTNKQNSAANTSPGVCFIYKSSPAKGAYTESTLERCFSDFYSDAAVALFSDSVESLMETVELGDKYYKINFNAIATNSILYPRYDAE